MFQEENAIIPSFERTLFDSVGGTAKDIFIEMAESGIDTVIQNDLLKSIPIVNVVSSFFRTGLALRERHFLQQTARFIASFNDGTILYEELEAHRRQLESNPVELEKELGRVILLLDSSVEKDKATILGAFYRHYLNKEFDWRTFEELSEINQRLFLTDCPILLQLYKANTADEEIPDNDLFRYQRLASLGLVIDQNMSFDPNSSSLMFSTTTKRFRLSSLGKTYVTHCK